LILKNKSPKILEFDIEFDKNEWITLNNGMIDNLSWTDYDVNTTRLGYLGYIIDINNLKNIPNVYVEDKTGNLTKIQKELKSAISHLLYAKNKIFYRNISENYFKTR